MKSLLSLFLIPLVSLSPVFAAGHVARGEDLAPRVRALENRILSSTSGYAEELSRLRIEYSSMPEGEDKAAAGIVLKAVSANPSTAATVLFSDNVDRDAAAAAGRLVKRIRGSTRGNAPLARTLDSIHDQLWQGESRFHWQTLFDGTPSFPEAELSRTDAVRVLPDGQRLNIKAAGEESLTPPSVDEAIGPVADPHVHDAIVIGAGYSGLSAAWHLRDRDILLIEREPAPGGLAYQGETRRSHVTYARGAAYYTEPEDEVKGIYDSVGMTSIDKTEIKEPIDSYFYKGELIQDVWSEESLQRLPPGFAKFKADLIRMDQVENLFDFDIPEDIPEKAKYLDKMTIGEFLKPYGPELTEFFDSYMQSALGGHVDQVGALGFLLFYSSEIVPRYTWPGGTGGGSAIMARKLWETHHHIFRTSSRVLEVRNIPIEGMAEGGVEVTYERDGKVRVVRAKEAIIAAPLKVAAKIVPQMPKVKKDLIAGIQYADYIVHSIFSSKDLFKGGYDTWFPSGSMSMTDVITGRWVETAGYTIAHDGPGILTAYMPIAPPATGRLTAEQMADLAAKAATDLRKLVPALADEKELAIESYRWPSSIHLTRPGYMTELVPQLIPADGHIEYAGNNLGPPAFETALVSGKRAAERVRAKLGLTPVVP